jgi:hypothetical protein
VVERSTGVEASGNDVIGLDETLATLTIEELCFAARQIALSFKNITASQV